MRDTLNSVSPIIGESSVRVFDENQKFLFIKRPTLYRLQVGYWYW